MKPCLMTIKEKLFYYIWRTCGILVKPFYFVGNWSVDKLNKSYYKPTHPHPTNQPFNRERIRNYIRKLVCRIFGHPLVGIAMADIYRSAINKEALGLYKCERCEEEIK